MNGKTIPRIELISATVIFGSIGVFVRLIDLPSSFIAMCRGLIAFVFMVVVILIRNKGFDFKQIKKELLPILISGAMIGFNWMLLFESYKYTTVAASTLFYYFAPVIVIICSPFIFKEKITLKKAVCMIVIVTGMVFVSGIANPNATGGFNLKGIMLALGAAVLYACVIMINKKVTAEPFNRTSIQMFMAGLVMVPYCLVTEDIPSLTFSAKSVIVLLIVCIVHTGIAYLLYFKSIVLLPAQTCGILSYIDPVVAVLCSTLILSEEMSLLSIAGAVMIIGGAVVSELKEKKAR